MGITPDFPLSSSQRRFLFANSSVVSLLLVFASNYLLSVTDAQQVQQNITSIDYNIYHHSDALLEEVQQLARRHPDLMLVESLKLAVDGYTSDIVVATVEHGTAENVSDDRYRVLLSFGQHGRELITSEVALRLLSTLVGEWNPKILDNGNIKKDLSKLTIKIVPMENYNGRKLVESGQFCERKNGRGVDINRNWSVDWGKKEQDFDPTEEYPGVAPFSEPETRIMRDIARTFNPHLWINVHSGMQAMFMPYDYKSELPDSKIVEPMKKLLFKLNQLYCNNSCVVGPGGGSVGYLAHGTATDYMYEVLAVPLAFTFEIYGDDKASIDDCFRMFNPIDDALFEETVTNWYMAFITIFEELEGVLHSLPRGVWAKGSVVSSTRKELSSYKRFQRDHEIDQEKVEWIHETWTLLEIIVMLSIVYAFVMWFFYLRDRKYPLSRMFSRRLPCNYREHM